MTSGLKNVGPRRTHRERAQPAARARLGLLDYRLRARDYHKKQDALATLREKAQFRNPEEFFHGMIAAGTKSSRRSGKELEREATAMRRNAEEHALALAHDVGYVATKRSGERASIKALQARLHFTEATAAAASASASSGKGRRIVFGEDGAVARVDGGVPEAQPALRRGHEEKRALNKAMRAEYRELDARLEREQRLRRLMLSMETERNLMGKGRRFRVKERDDRTGEPAVYRWRAQRKR